MPPKITQHPLPIDDSALAKTSHLLVVLPADLKSLPTFPGRKTLDNLLARRDMKPEELAKTPVSGDLPHGAMAVWTLLDSKKTPFERHTRLRKALQLLLAEKPKHLTIVVMGTDAERKIAAESAIYIALLNGPRLPGTQEKRRSQAA